MFLDLRILLSTLGPKRQFLQSLLGKDPSDQLISVVFGKGSVDHKAVISAAFRVSCHKETAFAPPPATCKNPPPKRVRRAGTGEFESRVLVGHCYPLENL